MWRRTYLVLTLVRLYFALCTSYLHPDENFQGPEVIAGHVFGYQVHSTWEFTSDQPIRSTFPLWLAYGFPMTVLKWMWEGSGHGQVRPAVVFWTLRVLMFLSSFVLEDWAIHELIDNPRQRKQAILLVASSYVTWTWQVHTFSNALETLVVLWTLVLTQRLKDQKGTRASLYNPAVLALLMIVGTFNRVTFPAYVLLPGLQAVPALWERNSHLIVFGLSAITTGLLAVLADTEFYSSTHPSFFDAIKRPIITPFNNVIYNLNPDNLKQHGIHPFYQHFVVNLPQFLGPTLPFVFNYIYGKRRSLTDISIPVRAALCGTLVLSFFSHQEARFLLPTVPLLLSAVNLPTGKRLYQGFIAAWFIFNLILGLLMGGYHQAGVYPAQIWLGEQGDQTVPTNANVFWWKTYSPPTWLLNGRSSELNTIDLMGLPKDQLQDRICDRQFEGPRLLVAPSSATFLDQFSVTKSFWKTSNRMGLDRMLWSTRSHLNLDDMDFGDDGIMPTLQRVIGKRGLAIWSVKC